MAIYFYEFPIGRLYIEEDEGHIVSIENDLNCLIGKELEETELIKKTKQELDEYFNGDRKEFSVPIKLEGSDFMIKVWNQLLEIPYGTTLCYSDIAKKIDIRNASRGVGMACGSNKIMIIVPCHRVIGKNKKLVGFSGGLDIKEKLLKIEQVNDFKK